MSNNPVLSVEQSCADTRNQNRVRASKYCTWQHRTCIDILHHLPREELSIPSVPLPRTLCHVFCEHLVAIPLNEGLLQGLHILVPHLTVPLTELEEHSLADLMELQAHDQRIFLSKTTDNPSQLDLPFDCIQRACSEINMVGTMIPQQLHSLRSAQSPLRKACTSPFQFRTLSLPPSPSPS
jgi:hypothetical protein